MNRTFKVAKSLTRGVVVTSEKASSYQGKAVKTVVAAAVAGVIAAVGGSAFAAKTTVDDLYLEAGASIVKDKDNTTAVINGTAYVDDKKTKWDADKYQHSADTKLHLNNATVTIDSTGTTGYFVMERGGVTGTGTISITAGEGAGDHQVGLGSTGAVKLDDADITLAYSATKGKESNVEFESAVNGFEIKGGTITVKTTAAAEADHNAEKAYGLLHSKGDMTLGHQVETNDIFDTDSTVKLVVAEGAQARIQVDDVTGTDNGGEAAAQTGTLNLENVVFANAGTLKLTASQINLDSAFNAADNAGKTVFEGNTTIGENFAGSVVEMNTAAKADKTSKQVFTGNVTVDAGAAFSADKLTVGNGTLTVKGEANNVGAGTLSVGEGVFTSGSHSFSGAETFDKLTIGNTASGATNAVTVTVGAGTLNVADTLTLKGNAGEKSTSGTATLVLNGGETMVKALC